MDHASGIGKAYPATCGRARRVRRGPVPSASKDSSLDRTGPVELESRRPVRRAHLAADPDVTGPRRPRPAYQEHFPAFQARLLPPGTAAAGSNLSSGTRGVPVEVLQTDVVQRWWLAFMLRDLEWCGIDPRGTLAAVRGYRDADPEKRR